MNRKIIISILLIMMALPALADNGTLQLPSAVRGWNTAPPEAQTWAQTLLDWGAIAVLLVAVGALLYHFIRGRFADQSGSIQTKNDSTSKMVEVVIGAVILVVAVGFIWFIFWK
jgi:uncharacterized membrane protein YeaQ/YmgE (transglycosylase-associated protein family)